MNFSPYPFERLNRLLEGIKPAESLIDFTIGEPQFATPDFITNEVEKHKDEFSSYPKSAGETYLKEAILFFLEHRFSINVTQESVIPTFGTREVLFNLPQFLLFDKSNKKIAFTNPFYQIYEGAAIASRAEIIYLDLENFDNKRAIELAKNCSVVILNYPNNPTGARMDKEGWREWVEAALEYNFILISDECYSDIYRGEPPVSVLEVAKEYEYKNVIALNSLSKRSSSAGLRGGFVCGDRELLRGYGLYRTYVGCAIPKPLQRAQALAWRDTKAAKEIGLKYANNMQKAEEILGIKAPDTTFYLWLEVGDGEEFAKLAYEKYALKLLPGAYLGRNGVGVGHIRVALVHEERRCIEGLNRLKEALEGR